MNLLVEDLVENQLHDIFGESWDRSKRLIRKVLLESRNFRFNQSKTKRLKETVVEAFLGQRKRICIDHISTAWYIKSW
jgi:hypothetical protein